MRHSRDIGEAAPHCRFLAKFPGPYSRSYRQENRSWCGTFHRNQHQQLNLSTCFSFAYSNGTFAISMNTSARRFQISKSLDGVTFSGFWKLYGISFAALNTKNFSDIRGEKRITSHRKRWYSIRLTKFVSNCQRSVAGHVSMRAPAGGRLSCAARSVGSCYVFTTPSSKNIYIPLRNMPQSEIRFI